MNSVLTQPTKILSIEDDPSVQRGITAFLEDSGFRTLEARDGQEGLETFRREHPDAVLCDLRLPRMDGLDVLSAITEESPDTPVIVVSGASRIGDAVQALKRGAWDYVMKPVLDMGVLENTLRRALERAELIRQNKQYRRHLETVNQELSSTLRQLREDVEAGRHIQFQFLPPDPWRFGEYVCSRRLYPSTYLSGDFVDYFGIDERHFGFYTADVSGHGAASAFVTIMLRTLINEYRDGYRTGGDDCVLHPSRLLARLNLEFCRQRLSKHLTLFYGVIDRVSNELSCSSGGHFPHPILMDSANACFLPIRGLPVGLFEDANFDTKQIALADSFSLLLLSDGALEVLPGNTQAERCASLLCQASANKKAGLDDLVKALGLDKNDKLPDDVALLLVCKG